MGIFELTWLGMILVGFFALIAYVAHYARSKTED